MDVIFVPLISAAIGAVAGTASSVWVTRTQLLIAFDKSRVEVLQLQLQKLEKVCGEMSSLKVDVQGDLSWEKILPRYTDRFINKSTLIRPYSHYLSKELSDKILHLSNVISGFIIANKVGQQIDEIEAQKTWEEMQITEKNIDDELAKRLRECLEEIEYLTLKKRSLKKRKKILLWK